RRLRLARHLALGRRLGRSLLCRNRLVRGLGRQGLRFGDGFGRRFGCGLLGHGCGLARRTAGVGGGGGHAGLQREQGREGGNEGSKLHDGGGQKKGQQEQRECFVLKISRYKRDFKSFRSAA